MEEGSDNADNIKTEVLSNSKRRKTSDIPLESTEDNNDKSPEIKNTKKSIWEEKCMICKENLFKYRCPRCEVLTCSLSCVNKHKKESKCSGKRDKTQYIPLSQFTEGDLISDLQFLRDAKQATDRFRKRRGMVHE